STKIAKIGPNYWEKSEIILMWINGDDGTHNGGCTVEILVRIRQLHSLNFLGLKH
ncbi:15072_t:CDS:1, partial [Dentiscutata erythropus]